MDIYGDSDDEDDDSNDEDDGDGTVLYRILYEDGDFEDLTELECRKVLNLQNKLESGEINEWEIGGDE